MRVAERVARAERPGGPRAAQRARPARPASSAAARTDCAPHVLTVGYNGANNTGAEALLATDIADLRSVLGPDVQLTVPTLNAANLRRYVQEGDRLAIAPVPTIFFRRVRELVAASDVVLLVEGSAYMDTWTPALLWYFLWATHCAHGLGRPSLAYAVDAGEMSPLNRRLTRRVGSETDLIVTRSAGAAERLRSFGVEAPIEVTADNAFRFDPDPADAGWLDEDWPQASAGVVGLALVDFNLFPVVVRPWGRTADCYRWPYYFSRSTARSRASEELAAGYAALAARIVAGHDRAVALICMEELDEPLARAVERQLSAGDRVRVFSSRSVNASRMTVLLRRLDALVTSRYHASILSLAAQVPQVAVGHDLRLRTLYDELGLSHLFHGADEPDLVDAVAADLGALLRAPEVSREALRSGYEEELARARRNPELLRAFFAAHGWPVRA
jgi:polysaccharide pyruvyl transferase WcaK-like protein